MQITQHHTQLSHQHRFERREEQLTLEIEHSAPNQQAADISPRVSVKVAPDEATHADDEALNDGSDIALLKQLVEMLSGRKVKTAEMPPADPASSSGPSLSLSLTFGDRRDDSAQATTTLSYSHLEEYERSNTTIQTTVTTADGRQITLDIQSLQERYYQETALQIEHRTAQPKDPLVINFSAEPAKLSEQPISFDLDGDGNLDQLPSLTSNSAYIALDRNGNGVIDNGLELFGPSSGSGFYELAQLDEDGNGFIDENDAAFSQLLAFRIGESPVSLESLGVGALFTGAIDSPFQLTDNRNNTLGVVASSGFYLNEEGGGGLLQQVDLMV